jgi:hypothetical protein
VEIVACTLHTELKILEKINVKYLLVNALQAYGKLKVNLHSALDGDERSASHPSHLSPK